MERVVLNLCRGFTERGYRADVLAATSAGAFREQLPAGARLVDLGARRVITSVGPLARYLRREQPQAVIAAMTHCSLAALWARHRAQTATRIIATEHIRMSDARRVDARIRTRVTPLFARRFLPKADHIVAVSAGVADDLALTLRIPRAGIEVIFNPVIHEGLFEQARERPEHPGLAPGAPPLVLAAGRLAPEKDFASLLQAFAMARKELDARLLILGEGPERVKLERLVQSLGLRDFVLLPGYEVNPYAYMARAQVFALTSRWEGFGVVLVEALALGANVVATDCPTGPREIVERVGCGRLVPVGSTRELAAARIEALRAPRNGVDPQKLSDYRVSNVVERYRALIEPEKGIMPS